MEANEPTYRAGQVGETIFILSSYGVILASLPRQKLDTCQKSDTCLFLRHEAQEQ